MGRYVFKLPDVGEGTAEAELVGWHVKVGDMVAEDQIVADVMTDKATVEITSPVAGKVSKLHGQPGQQMAVRAPLIEFEVEGAGNAGAEEPEAANPSTASRSPSPSLRDGEETLPRAQAARLREPTLPSSRRVTKTALKQRGSASRAIAH